MSARRRYLHVVGCLVSLLPACSSSTTPSGSATVHASEQTVADSSHLLSASNIHYIAGTYGSDCTNPGYPSDWSNGFYIPGPAWNGSTDSPGVEPLSVVKDNSTCELRMTTVVGTKVSDGSLWSLTVASGGGGALALADSYPGTAAQLLDTSFDSGPNQFVAYVNGMTAESCGSGVRFCSNFVVDLEISDTVSTGDAGTVNGFQVATATMSESLVAAPDYTASATGTITYNTSGNPSYIDGSLSLAWATQGGQSWAIVHDDDLTTSTFSQVNAAYNAATAGGYTQGTWGTSAWATSTFECGDDAYPAACPSFNLNNFFITGADTVSPSPPLTDSLIIQNASANGVFSYEVVAVTFSATSD